MNKVKVKDSNSLYRDEESGAILNCNDTAYNNYLKLKEKKLEEAAQMEKPVSYTHLTLPTTPYV